MIGRKWLLLFPYLRKDGGTYTDHQTGWKLGSSFLRIPIKSPRQHLEHVKLACARCSRRHQMVNQWLRAGSRRLAIHLLMVVVSRCKVTLFPYCVKSNVFRRKKKEKLDSAVVAGELTTSRSYAFVD